MKFLGRNPVMGFVRREYSKNRIAKAGEKIAKDTATDEDWDVLTNWRGVHTYVLNSFQGNIKRNIEETRHEFAQRLKRKNTIVNKLRTGRASDLASMHDIAGCRIICSTLHDLDVARSRIHGSRAKHVYKSNGKYDYIATPKPTGYRGIHDVFEYKVEGSSGEEYNGLKVEIQYRTKVQHAWATALEISDVLDHTRVKFESGINPEKERFFVLASEYLARKHENMSGFLPDMTIDEIVEEIRDIESRIHVLHKLKHSSKRTQVPQSRNIVLHFTGDRLEAVGFNSIQKALAHTAHLELIYPEHDVVYVRADDPTEIRSAFRNYFTNSVEFLRLMPSIK